MVGLWEGGRWWGLLLLHDLAMAPVCRLLDQPEIEQCQLSSLVPVHSASQWSHPDVQRFLVHAFSFVLLVSACLGCIVTLMRTAV